MSRQRPAGYDKYYMNASCKECGGYTNVEYAWRFGESEPHVYCRTCKLQKDIKDRRTQRHNANTAGLVSITCLNCGDHPKEIGSLSDHSRYMDRREVGENPADDKCAVCRRKDRVADFESRNNLY